MLVVPPLRPRLRDSVRGVDTGESRIGKEVNCEGILAADKIWTIDQRTRAGRVSRVRPEGSPP